VCMSNGVENIMSNDLKGTFAWVQVFPR
jgi:hypothetical protein